MDEIIKKIRAVAEELPQVRIMEVCGGHTNTIIRYGLRELIPSNIKLISGPGCPVCVTSQRDIDSIIELALNGVKIATYGDMMNVPGTRMSLREAASEGADIQEIYSVDQIEEKDRIFFGIGFETTTPMTGALLKKGFTVFSSHKLIPPAMEIIKEDMNIQGFINPGHVSTITGSKMWEKLNLAVPQVISGFKPEQMLRATYTLLKMIRDGEKGVANEYPEAVTPEGNTVAKKIVEETMIVTDSEWRGMGTIGNSGLSPRKEEQDARIVYSDMLEDVKSVENKNCRCGDVIKGLIEPRECKLFGVACTPASPKGACMVSEYEGACAIAYRYGRSLSENE